MQALAPYTMQGPQSNWCEWPSRLTGSPVRHVLITNYRQLKKYGVWVTSNGINLIPSFAKIIQFTVSKVRMEEQKDTHTCSMMTSHVYFLLSKESRVKTGSYCTANTFITRKSGCVLCASDEAHKHAYTLWAKCGVFECWRRWYIQQALCFKVVHTATTVLKEVVHTASTVL